MPNKQVSPVVRSICDGHVLIMKAGGLVCGWLDRSNGNPYDAASLRILNEAASMAHLSARLMQHQQSAHGLWLRARHLPGMAELGVSPEVISAPTSAPAAKLHAATGQARGRLNNGNPSGDYLKSPRCGARTRSGGCCRQPAMKSPRGGGGRCRMHGGMSTGPRTPEGLARCRRTRYVHGFRSRPILQFRRRAVHTARHLRDLTATLRLALRTAVPAGHGLHRLDLLSSAGFATPLQKINHGDHRVHGEDSADMSHSMNKKSFSVSSVSSSSSVVSPVPAGHGVHRPDLACDPKPRARAAA